MLAAQVGFKDDPQLKDDQQMPLEKTVGWLPVKELFNIQWQHQEFMNELAGSGDQEVTEAQKTKLAEIEKQRDGEIDAFLPDTMLAR